MSLVARPIFYLFLLLFFFTRSRGRKTSSRQRGRSDCPLWFLCLCFLFFKRTRCNILLSIRGRSQACDREEGEQNEMRLILLLGGGGGGGGGVGWGIELNFFFFFFENERVKRESRAASTHFLAVKKHQNCFASSEKETRALSFFRTLFQLDDGLHQGRCVPSSWKRREKEKEREREGATCFPFFSLLDAPSISTNEEKPFSTLFNNKKTGAVVQKRPWHASVLAFFLAVVSAIKGFLSTIFYPDAAANYKKKGSGGGNSGGGGLGLGGGGGFGGGSGGGNGGGPGSRPRVGGMSSLWSVNPPAGGGCCGGVCG